MAKILGPRLVFFGGLAEFPPRSAKCFPEAVRVEIREADGGKRPLKYFSNWPRTTPMLPINSHRMKLMFTASNLGAGKEGIVQSPKFVLLQITYPVHHLIS